MLVKLIYHTIFNTDPNKRTTTAELSDTLIYVWSEAFIGSETCTSLFQTDPECRTHTWEEPGQLERLVETVAKGKIRHVLLSGTYGRIIEKVDGAFHCKCPGDEVYAAVTLLHEAGSEVYALFAASDEKVSERYFVPCVEEYNEKCATSESHKFDGVSVNNEHLSTIISNFDCNNEMVIDHLDKLTEIKTRAAPLPFHFSVGWWWGSSDKCGDITYANRTQSLTKHIIDIIDSLDIQVATNVASMMVNRAADATYAIAKGKRAWVLAYTSAGKGATSLNCYTGFYDSGGKCTGSSLLRCQQIVDGNKRCSQSGMRSELSTATKSMPGLLPGIHAYHNAYQSGLPGWEKFNYDY